MRPIDPGDGFLLVLEGTAAYDRAMIDNDGKAAEQETLKFWRKLKSAQQREPLTPLELAVLKAVAKFTQPV